MTEDAANALVEVQADTVLLRFADRQEVIPLDGPESLFRIHVHRCERDADDILVPSSFRPPRLSKEGSTLAWTFGDGDPLRVTVRLRGSGPEVLASLTLENADPDLTVTRVQFPYVVQDPVLPIDRLLMASAWGDDIPRPVRSLRHYCDGRDQGFWIYDYVHATEDEVSYAYPSIMAMQFMVLHNPGRALYLACYGLGNATRTFNAQILGANGLGLSINHYPFAGAGSWSSPPCAIALLPGGWHAAADTYAAHMRDHFQAPDLPAWMRDPDQGFHGWAQVMLRQEGKPPRHTFRDLPDLARRAREVGLNGLHIAGWTYDGFDTYYPDFDHDPQLGTAEELHAAMDEMRADGTHAILYTNGRLVDPRSDFYRAGGDAALCLDEKGDPYVESYGTSAEFRIACPACHSYGDAMADRIGNLITRYGAHAAQVDQISCNHAYFCYDADHPHTTPATNFLPGVEYELRAIRGTHKALDPDFYVWCEGCHERFGQFYDVNQGHGEELTWALGDGVPELFSYVYPDYIVTGLASSLQQLCYAYAQGKPLDVPLRLLDDAAYAALLRRLLAVRKRYPSFFLSGRFVDSIGLLTTGAVRAFRLEHQEDARSLVNLWMPGAAPEASTETRLQIDRPVGEIAAVYPASLRIIQDGNRLDLSWLGPVATLIV